MTVWNYSISWSKLDLASKCLRALGYACDKTPAPGFPISYWKDLGSVVQKTFELYYNQQINLKPGGQNPAIVPRMTDKVLNSAFRANLNTVYPFEKNEDNFREDVHRQTRKGFESMRNIGLTKLKVTSEVKVNAVMGGFRIFALIDFLRYGRSGIYIFDGKGHHEENADPDQVRYYATAFAAQGRKVAGGGLIYWEHGHRNVDVSPEAIRDFINRRIDPYREVFTALKKGTNDLPPSPEAERCKRCPWRSICDKSPHYKDPNQTYESGEVNFGSTEV